MDSNYARAEVIGLFIGICEYQIENLAQGKIKKKKKKNKWRDLKSVEQKPVLDTHTPSPSVSNCSALQQIKVTTYLMS